MQKNRIVPRSNLNVQLARDDEGASVYLRMEPECAGSWDAWMRFPKKGIERIPASVDKIPQIFLTVAQEYIETLDSIIAGKRLDLLSALNNGIDSAIAGSESITKLIRPVHSLQHYSENLGRHTLVFFGGSEIESWSARIVLSLHATESLYSFPAGLQTEICQGLQERAGWYLATVGTVVSRDLPGIHAMFGDALANGVGLIRAKLEKPFR